jgi:mannitol-specific phosphotransferase system IIBC component
MIPLIKQKMFSLDRETAMMVAVVVSLLVSAYLYRELQKQKQDMSTIQSYTVSMSKQMSQAPANDAPKKKPVVEEDAEVEED